ncbi:hypothetical protein F5Y17DRAFT_425330 [Xylariaceae sp. FL0594]|nr:hypothetical protein F5Y17DRAFT_425330 [Xylariaceae sp. FL0594]
MAAAAPPSTTIVPFASLPSCAAKCGPLWDANGACVPPHNPATDESSWDSCFCGYGSLQPLKSGANDVCNGACSSDPQGLPGIQSWFTSLCNNKAVNPTATTTPSTANPGTGAKTGGGDWASTHINWIVFIVVVVVAIVGIWTGACIWRRKYLKKKDRLHELGKGLPSSVAINTNGPNEVKENAASSGPGMFMTAPGSSSQRNTWGSRS